MLKPKQSCRVVLSSALSLWLSTSIALAQPPADKGGDEAAKADRKTAQQARKDARQAMREGRKEARQAMHEGRQEARAAMHEARQEAAQAMQQADPQGRGALAKPGDQPGMGQGPGMGHGPGEGRGLKMGHARTQARMRRWQKLRERIVAAQATRAKAGNAQLPNAGEVKAAQVPAPVRAELKIHARRMARINRIAVLAKMKSDDKALKRLEGLREKEQARHQKHMDQLIEAPPGNAGEAPKAEEAKGKGPDKNEGDSEDNEGDEEEQEAQP